MPGVKCVAWSLFLLLPLACRSEVVTLGRASAAGTSSPRAPEFSSPTLVAELMSDGDENSNPTLTFDLLEIYFTSRRQGGTGDVDVWSARRAAVDEPFSVPQPVSPVNTDGFETSPAVSLDGLELWVGSERDGGLGKQDIWLSRRSSRDEEWGEPTNVMELNSAEKDIPRPPAVGGTIMPLASQRASSGYYQTYLARRASVRELFSEPFELTELEATDQNSVDGFLTEDGLTLFFNRSPGSGENNGELYVARRPSLNEPFGDAMPLSSVNTSADERDPWLSPDGQHLYFSSDRDGTLDIYEARLIAP
jgi:hypothetical protein